MSIPKRLKRPRMGLRESSVIRSPAFLSFVRRHECSALMGHDILPTCGGSIEAAHVRSGTDGGVGIKPSDCYALPLCSGHHREQHQRGEKTFERKYKIDMRAIADALWNKWLSTTESGRKYRLSAQKG